MVLKKNDFIEIEFTGKLKDGEIFDSNIKEDIKNSELKTKAKPFIYCLGNGMFLKSIDDFLIGKEISTYNIELSPEQAFGKRDSSLIKMVPSSVFEKHELNPVVGGLFNFDGMIGKVLVSSGGRILVDFNNPLAGKDVEYKINVLRKVNDINEKAKSLIEFFFKRDLKFEIKDKKLILELEPELFNLGSLFKDKFKEMLGLELEIVESKKQEQENKEKSNGSLKE